MNLIKSLTGSGVLKRRHFIVFSFLWSIIFLFLNFGFFAHVVLNSLDGSGNGVPVQNLFYWLGVMGLMIWILTTQAMRRLRHAGIHPLIAIIIPSTFPTIIFMTLAIIGVAVFPEGEKHHDLDWDIMQMRTRTRSVLIGLFGLLVLLSILYLVAILPVYNQL